MKAHVFLILAFAVGLQGGCSSQAVHDSWDIEKLKEAKAFADASGTFAFILITDGETVAAWGDTTTATPIHSARKAIKSALFGQYVGKGRIDLGKTLQELGIDDAPVTLTELQRQATVLHLLKCTSGINHGAAGETEGMTNDKNMQLGAEPNPPGTKWAYNNTMQTNCLAGFNYKDLP